MSDWIQIAFVSTTCPSPSPVVSLNYFGDSWEGILCDTLPMMPTGDPAASLAAFVTACWNAIRDPRCVLLRNLEIKQDATPDNWLGDQSIWNAVDALVDVDRWVVVLRTGERPISGSENQRRFDPERFDRWPRRFARLISLFK